MNSNKHARTPFVPAHGSDHLRELIRALPTLDLDTLERWGTELYGVVSAGGRLLVAGNGGSAAEAQHLTAELVGRYGRDRRPFSAIALSAETSTLTAISNDYSFSDVFARQVEAHGRPGDILLVLSTSGRSKNVVSAVATARRLSMTTWALTGSRPNPLADVCDETVSANGITAVTQEQHLTAVHLICESFERAHARADQLPEEAPTAPSRMVPIAALRPAHLVKESTESGAADRILVIGDALLDQDTSGRVERLSPEAPVPVVDSLVTILRPGGAGLAAVLAIRLGKRVTFLTALADDARGHQLHDLLTAEGIEVVDLGAAGRTPVKTRIRSGGRSLLMLDDTTPPAPVRETVPALLAERSFSAVLVSDYGRGITASPSVRQLIDTLGSRSPVVWDPHPCGTEPVAGIRLVTPNRREAAHFAAEVTGDRLNSDVERARVLLRRWPVAAIAVTLGEQGAVLLESPSLPPLVVPLAGPAAHGRIADSCGAGDFFALNATIMLSEGALLSEAISGATAASAEYVANGGPTMLDRRSASQAQPGAVPADGLEVIRRVRTQGGTVVATGGCFDLLHRGHVALLEQARRLGDCLVVCLNSDESVARLKGSARPVVALPDRAMVLQALSCVDAVIVFDEDTPLRLLGELRPDIFVKGGDYSNTEIPETALIEKWGGQVVTVPYLDGRSTTSLITRAVQIADSLVNS